MCIFYGLTKKKALPLMPVWQRADAQGGLYYTFLVPNDTINHLGLWEHCVGALCAMGAGASSRSPLLGAAGPPHCTVPLYCISPAPHPRHCTPHLPSIPCCSQCGWRLHFLLRPLCLYLGADLVCVSKTVFLKPTQLHCPT